MVRKAAVFCIVKLYVVLGEERVRPKFSMLNSSKVRYESTPCFYKDITIRQMQFCNKFECCRLLNVYIGKAQNKMGSWSNAKWLLAKGRRFAKKFCKLSKMIGAIPEEKEIFALVSWNWACLLYACLCLCLLNFVIQIVSRTYSTPPTPTLPKLHTRVTHK